MYKLARLRDLRHDKDLRQEDVAKMLSTTKQQYSLWEQGKREIPVHKLIILARFYNVSLDYIVGMIDDPRPLV